MQKDAVLSVIRHVLTTAGGSMATGGIIASDDIALVAGAITTILGVLWGVLDKRWN